MQGYFICCKLDSLVYGGNLGTNVALLKKAMDKHNITVEEMLKRVLIMLNSSMLQLGPLDYKVAKRKADEKKKLSDDAQNTHKSRNNNSTNVKIL